MNEHPDEAAAADAGDEHPDTLAGEEVAPDHDLDPDAFTDEDPDDQEDEE